MLAPSAIQANAQMYTDAQGLQPLPIPPAMSGADIADARDELVRAARNALRAGLYGVELHSANGYVREQFLHPHSNPRSDEYGRSAEHRQRFVLEIVRAVADASAPERVGIRISPYSTFNDLAARQDVRAEYAALAHGLCGMTYVHIVGSAHPRFAATASAVRDAFAGPIHLERRLRSRARRGRDRVRAGRAGLVRSTVHCQSGLGAAARAGREARPMGTWIIRSGKRVGIERRCALGHKPDMALEALRHQLSVAASIMTSSVELWRGCLVEHAAKQPAQPLTLYEYEACPYCRVVREALTALHLDVQIRPCPRNGQRFRPEALRLGGKQQFPLLIDPNTRTQLYESRDIVRYLFQTYGNGSVPRRCQPRATQPVSNVLAFMTRLGSGAFARPSRGAAQPLHLWSFEGSPYSRLVREQLCELELPYTLHNLGKEHWREAGPAVRRIAPNPYVPREGGKRHAFWQAHRRVQVPYLEDPNTGTHLFESRAILEYLQRTYAL